MINFESCACDHKVSTINLSTLNTINTTIGFFSKKNTTIGEGHYNFTFRAFSIVGVKLRKIIIIIIYEIKK